MSLLAPKNKTYEPPKVSGHIKFSPLAAPEPISFLGSSFWQVKEALKATFGEFPFNLDPTHLPILKAMAVASGEGSVPYQNLIDGLEKHGGISVNMERAAIPAN